MEEMPWHLQRAKDTLDEWYAIAETNLRQERFFLNLVVPSEKYAGLVRGEALHCKTAGLVWHDRYKMILDCQREGVTR